LFYQRSSKPCNAIILLKRCEGEEKKIGELLAFRTETQRNFVLRLANCNQNAEDFLKQVVKK
jgi:hypothetical protein